MLAERSGKRLAFKLKLLSREAISGALEKAEQHRRLKQPWEAESVCRDILEVDPTNSKARITLLLALIEQFDDDPENAVHEAKALLDTLEGEYEKAYYAGVICEYQAKERLAHGTLGAGPAVYELFARAMTWFEKAEKLRPAGVDDAILRWNTCARMIMRNDLRPAPGPPRGA